MNAQYHIIVFGKNDFLQSLIYPFISPNFVSKNGIVQHSKRLRDKCLGYSIKMH